ncbi:ABC transporter permease [Halomicrococcus gelatinilyticus]|uniref:ABC transporter permease n=1 Tax=Halomicrococcus gelatinilyticus TaxID=1702103 RepID=UPI002E133E6F
MDSGSRIRALRSNRLVRSIVRPPVLIALGLLAPLVLFAAYPLAILVSKTVVIDDVATLAYWRSVLFGVPNQFISTWGPTYSETLVWQPLKHSLVVATGTTVVAVVVGTTLAALVSLTDIRFKSLLTTVAIYQVILPPFALATAWIIMGQRLEFPATIRYGPEPMVLVLAVHFYPFVYLITSAAFRKIDFRLLEAAFVHGVPKRTALREVVLPLAGPAVVGSGALVAFSSLAVFAPVEILGGGSDPYRVLSTQIFALYQNALSTPTIMPIAAIASLLLTVVSLLPFLGYYVMLERSRTETVSGQGTHSALFELGAYRTPISLVVLGVFLSTVVVPLGFLGLQSVSPSWALFDVSAMSLDAYRAILSSPPLGYSLLNSMIIGISAATIGTITSLFVSYVLVAGTNRFLKLTTYGLSLVSFVLPGVALGVAYLLVVSQPLPVPGSSLNLRFLYGSIFLVIVVTTVRNLPFGVQSTASSLVQIDDSLVEAGYLNNAGFPGVFRAILVPLVRRSLVASWILVFIFAVKELDVIMFLYSPQPFTQGAFSVSSITDAPPIMYQVFYMLNAPQNPELYSRAAALLIIVSAVILVGVLTVKRLTAVDLDQLITA